MSQNEKPNSCLCPIPCATSAPELLAHLHVMSYPALPVPLNAGERPAEEPDIMDIRAVGIGSLGSRMVQLLSRNLSGVTCHEIIHDVEQEASGDMAALLSSVQSSDLVFILSGFDDEYCESIAQAVGGAACGAGVLNLVVTPPTGTAQIPHQCDSGQKWFDSIFCVSEESLPSQEDAITLRPESLNGYAMRHVVAVIGNLILNRTGICIDFNDLAKIMREGSAGRMGIGIAADPARGATAAERAIERLERQGINIASATGVLASVHGSSQLTMDDFDAACKVIHGQISVDANIIVGLISDDQMGSNVKVTLLTVHQC